MSATERKIQLVKKDTPEHARYVSMLSSDMRAYLTERRRALLTELEALNRVLNLEPLKTK